MIFGLVDTNTCHILPRLGFCNCQSVRKEEPTRSQDHSRAKECFAKCWRPWSFSLKRKSDFLDPCYENNAAVPWLCLKRINLFLLTHEPTSEITMSHACVKREVYLNHPVSSLILRLFQSTWSTSRSKRFLRSK